MALAWAAWASSAAACWTCASDAAPRRRLVGARHPGFLVGRTILADLVLPILVLAGFPLWIGSTGSSPPGDVLAGWRFMLWTLPDLAVVLLVLAFGGLAVGVAKLVLVRAASTARRA